MWIINGPETHYVKVFSTVNSEAKNVFGFSFEDTRYEVENTIGTEVWLRLVRNEHLMSGYYSSDGYSWIQIGETLKANDIDIQQTQFNNFTGNQQGLYVKGKSGFFDLYIYRDAYSAISSANPANKFKTSVTTSSTPPNILSLINNGDWVMYAGVEFGNEDYLKQADSITVEASGNEGIIEVVLDSLTGTRVAEIHIGKTGSWTAFRQFTAAITSKISGYHDVYLKFSGSGTNELFRLKTVIFSDKDLATSVNEMDLNPNHKGYKFELLYPSPNYRIARIKYYVPHYSAVSLKVFNENGQAIKTLISAYRQSGNYELEFNSEGLPN